MLAEDTVFEITVRFYKGGNDPDSLLDFKDLKKRTKEIFEKAQIISQGSSEAKIISVKTIKKEI